MPFSISIPSPNTSSRRALILFIPGNPGLISFYTPFLTILSSLLSSPDTTTTAYDIYGQNLLGFADEDHEPFSGTNPPWDLEGQIEAIGKAVEKKGAGYDFVVLMGHSVGAYIAVETFSRWRKYTASSKISLKNGMLLFPTLLHIAQSPSGRKLLRLSQTGYVADNAHLVARALLILIPTVVLQWVLGTVIGFTKEATGVTTRWLKSRDGVRQALFLGMDEMRKIGEDVWEDDLWEVTALDVSSSLSTTSSPRFYLFYAQEDHWVDSRGRDEFLKKLEGRVKVKIEGEGVKHAFCTKERKSFSFSKGCEIFWEPANVMNRRYLDCS